MKEGFQPAIIYSPSPYTGNIILKGALGIFMVPDMSDVWGTYYLLLN